MMNRTLKDTLAAGEGALGLWVTLESATVTEIAAELGLDWVAIDLEHGQLGRHDVLNHLRAAHRGPTSVLVRVPSGTEEWIKAALDLGADGILVPLVRSVADVERAVRFAHYPPQGRRTVGLERAVRWGLGASEYLATANDDVLVVPIIETAEALDCLDEILDVPGIGAVFVGPGDLSACQGYLGEWEGPGVADQVLAVSEAAAARGLAAGLVVRGADDLLTRRDQGFRMLALGSDTSLLIAALQQLRDVIGRRGTAPAETTLTCHESRL